MDTVSKWCLGQIVARDDNQVMVRFDGWSNRWDATCRWTSYKIAPFRRWSKGYTGQVKTPLRAQMSFKVEEVERLRERVDNLIQNDFRGLPAYELTQFIRGYVFVHVEYILSQGEYSESDCKTINDLLEAVVRLIVAWLKKVPSIMQRCLQELKKNPELCLVDEDIALFQCGGELMVLLQSMLCGCHRNLRYYLHCD